MFHFYTPWNVRKPFSGVQKWKTGLKWIDLDFEESGKYWLFKRQPHKIAKRTQTIRQLLSTNWVCLTFLRGWRLKG